MDSDFPHKPSSDISSDTAGVAETDIRVAWSEIEKLAATLSRSDVLESLRPDRERFDLGIFRLVVMGEIKKGKSSFINALLGEEELLPTASDVATSTVYKVLYGPEKRFKVFFQPDVDTGVRPPPLDIAVEQLASYGTQDGNPNNRKRVDFIGVEVPNPLLKEGLVLVDTPGVGGLFREHRDITWRYAPNSDAVFFVLDSVEAVVSQDEIEFLHELLAKVTRRVFFVQTKTDLAGTEQWQAWRDRNRVVLSEQLQVPIARLHYFPVSSKLKAVADKRHSGRHLQDSGFLDVLGFLHGGLMRAKKRIVARELGRRLLNVIAELRRELTERLRIVQAGSREELERIGQVYAQARCEFDEWQRVTLPREKHEFFDKLTALKQQASARLQDELDPKGPIVTDIIEQLRRNRQVDARSLNDSPLQYQHECLARAAEVAGIIQAEFNANAKKLIDDALPRLVPDFLPRFPAGELANVDNNQSTPVTLVESLNRHFSRFEDVRNVVYGGIAG